MTEPLEFEVRLKKNVQDVEDLAEDFASAVERSLQNMFDSMRPRGKSIGDPFEGVADLRQAGSPWEGMKDLRQIGGGAEDTTTAVSNGMMDALNTLGIVAAIVGMADVLLTGFKPLLNLLKLFLTLMGLMFLPIAIPLVKALLPVVALLAQWLGTVLKAGQTTGGQVGAGVGAIAGGAIGFSVGGPIGAVAGAAIGSGIGAVVGSFIQNLIASAQPIFQSIIKSISGVLNTLGQIFAPLMPVISAAINTVIFPFHLAFSILETIGALLLDAIEAIANAIPGIASAVGNWINNNVIKPIATFLGPIITAISNIVTQIGDWINTNIVKPLGTILQPLLDAFSSMINGFIGAINSVIDTLKSVSIPNPFGGKLTPFSWMQDISPVHLASGGLVTKRTNVVIGESGPEMVIPLNRAGSAAGGMHVHVHGDIYGDDAAFEARMNRVMHHAIRSRGGGTYASGH